MRARSKKWTRLSDAISDVLGRKGLKKKMRQYQLWSLWDEIAGPSLAKNARPLRWQGNILVVGVKHASWMQEIAFLKPDILQKIQAAIPHIQIADIRFELADIQAAAEGACPPAAGALPPLSIEEEEFINLAARQIKDSNTRRTAREVMTKDFRLKKKKGNTSL